MLNRQGKILLYGASLWYLGEGMLGPLFAVFAQRIGGNILDIAWAWAIYLIVTGLFTMIMGNLADKFDKTKMIVAGYSLNALFTFAYLLVRTPLELFLVQAGLGLAIAIAGPSWSALYSKYADKDRGGLAWGIADGNWKLVTGFAVIIGGAIVNYTSFETLFWTMGLVQVVAAIYQASVLSLDKA